jgi:Rrf2 family protein
MKPLSIATVHAVKALAHLAAQEEPRPLSARTMARVLNTPETFTGAVLHRLVVAKVLRSEQSCRGGFRLARPASKITLLEAIEAVEGPIRGLAPLTKEGRSRAFDAQLQAVCEDIADLVRRRLASVRLSDLAAPRTRTGRPVHSVATAAAARSSARSTAS